MKAIQFTLPEKRSGRRIYAIIMEYKTSLDLINVGEGRKDPKRWKSATYADVILAHKEGTIEFLGWDEESVHLIAEGKGAGRHAFIREAAQEYLWNRQLLTTAPTTGTALDVAYPRVGHHHTYRPQGFDRR